MGMKTVVRLNNVYIQIRFSVYSCLCCINNLLKKITSNLRMSVPLAVPNYSFQEVSNRRNKLQVNTEHSI
jgi:hypothetical protein